MNQKIRRKPDVSFKCRLISCGIQNKEGVAEVHSFDGEKTPHYILPTFPKVRFFRVFTFIKNTINICNLI